MDRPLDKIKDLTAIAQNVAVTIAVVIGGFWALYVFTALEQREKAELDVKKASLEKLKQEQELQPRAILDLNLSISQPDWHEKSKHLVQVVITAKNMGNRLEILRLPPAPIHVYALSTKQDGSLSLRSISPLSQLESPRRFSFHSMSPTEGMTAPPILISMPSSGVYLFEVCAPLGDIEELMTSKHERSNNSLIVCDTQFYSVK